MLLDEATPLALPSHDPPENRRKAGLTPATRPPDNPVVAKGSAEFGSTANRYQILGKLAVGGMAEIFLARGAHTTGLVRYCVLKRILPERAPDAQFVQMFLAQAKRAAQ